MSQANMLRLLPQGNAETLATRAVSQQRTKNVRALSSQVSQANPRALLHSLALFPAIQSRKHRTLSVIASSAASFSGDESSGPSKPFPRIGVRDPYKRLGLSRDASTEEITEAKKYLVEEYGWDERSREAVEEAFDRIIAEKFRERRRSKINLKADLKKKVSEAPPWLRAFAEMLEVPSSTVLLQRAALYALIAVWSVMNPAEGGPAFQVAVALGLSVYLLNERLKSIGRAFLLGFGALVIGWVAGSFIVPFIPPIPFTFWSLELGTALITYIFLWFTTTFLK